MKPLVCFYQHDSFIYSTDYQVLPCPQTTSLVAFLKHFEIEEPERLKIIQVNFEAQQEDLFSAQTKLYDSAKAHLILLNEFQKLSWPEVLQKLASQDSKDLIDLPRVEFQSLTGQKKFMSQVEVILDQIRRGRIYQVNFTSPLATAGDFSSVAFSAEALFLKYQEHFSGAYKALIPLPNHDLLSFSPELFLFQENGLLRTRPIKGSLPQSMNFSKSLLANKKEEAELSMIVDLLRNDLNSLDYNAEARVTAHREALSLGYIQHSYSEIQVASTWPLSHVLPKTFPGGSISGCPKIESLRVISELEKFQRQAYTGVLGWWQNNDFCLNITIRSLINTPTKLFYHAGCGIVFDSSPEKEWQEFLLKTGVLHVGS